MKTLHIVDGESTGGTLRRARPGREEEILRWRDALYTGPVPSGLSLRRLSRVRSQFWTNGKSNTEFDKRDACLLRYRQFDEVVMWFGADCTLCQLSLAQVLSWLYEQKTAPHRLSWVSRHGGELTAEHMHAAYRKRKPLHATQLREASHTWDAFRASSPEALARRSKLRTSCIPGHGRAIHRMLQEYPWLHGGLSRLERKLLRVIQAEAELQAAKAVATVLQTETVGDLLLFDMLRDFDSAPNPIVRYAAPFTNKINSYKFNSAMLTLTDTGRRVLSGKDDHVTLNGVDRWIGGVHLHGHSVPWRWDEQHQRIVRSR
jgi:hypothetical protein